MRTTTTTARWLVRVCGIVLLVLGTLFWTGNATSLIPLHRVLGFLLVASLLVVVVVAARAGAPPALVGLAVVWAVVVPIVGMTQDDILTGSAHWVIRVVHLLLGVGAVALSERLSGLVLDRPAVAS